MGTIDWGMRSWQAAGHVGHGKADRQVFERGWDIDTTADLNYSASFSKEVVILRGSAGLNFDGLKAYSFSRFLTGRCEKPRRILTARFLRARQLYNGRPN